MSSFVEGKCVHMPSEVETSVGCFVTTLMGAIDDVLVGMQAQSIVMGGAAFHSLVQTIESHPLCCNLTVSSHAGAAQWGFIQHDCCNGSQFTLHCTSYIRYRTWRGEHG